MANRTGTYVAFDGLNQTNPTLSDFRYYSTMQAWAAVRGKEFRYVNSHEKTSAVRDTSLRPTLERKVRERLTVSKSCLAILSKDTRATGSMLSYEIEQVVDRYEIPLILTYPDFEIVCDPASLAHRWPNALRDRIQTGKGTMIHIPFKQGAILDAITYQTVHNYSISGNMNFYSREAHINMGCIQA